MSRFVDMFEIRICCGMQARVGILWLSEFESKIASIQDIQRSISWATHEMKRRHFKLLLWVIASFTFVFVATSIPDL